jgi:hypothetical protein
MDLRLLVGTDDLRTDESECCPIRADRGMKTRRPNAGAPYQAQSTAQTVR